MDSLNLNRISDFIRIVECGNITRAAEAMGERKAKLSRSLALLEKELGLQLVYRTTRQFKLTESGAEFYQSMREQFGQLESSISKLMSRDEDIAGKIRITAPEDLGKHLVTGIVHEFCLAHPRVQFELLYTNEVLDLVKKGVDVAFRIAPLKDSTFLQRRIGVVDHIVVASPRYLEKAGVPSRPEDLIHHQTIGFGNPEKCFWQLVSRHERRRIPVNPRISSNNFLAIKDLVLRGWGIGFVPRYIAQDEVEAGDLVHLLRPWGHEGMPVRLLMPGQKNIAKRIRKFFDFSVKKASEYFS